MSMVFTGRRISVIRPQAPPPEPEVTHDVPQVTQDVIDDLDTPLLPPEPQMRVRTKR